MNFLSDNAYGAAPEILAAIAKANDGAAPPYGDDEITSRLTRRFCEVFEREVVVFPVVTGTAANALALAALVPPYGAIFCHEENHIAVDECSAPEFFSGGARLVPLNGVHGKITPETIERALPLFQRGVHSPVPSAISITQATERGTVYKRDEIAALSELARRHRMTIHMDGARFANALAHLGCTPAELTWKVGVDALSFGATKNGALCAEAVILFDPSRAQDLEYRRKRGGHLISKMRFISAQLEAYLLDDRWLNLAHAANANAQTLAISLSGVADMQLAEPVEANEVFVCMPVALAAKLKTCGATFYEWDLPADDRVLIRLVVSPLTPDSDIQKFIRLVPS
ncbi:MAG: low specificity L-threonine aldolase [Alphaproteobacteria bacterium]|nr:low specificity L-threonine aldolase [Alphaproteobacteria bacterium]